MFHGFLAEQIKAASKARADKQKADKKAAKESKKFISARKKADKKARQQRINNILSGKFGVNNPYGLSPTELADLESLGIDPNKAEPMTDIQQDIFDQMMEKNDRFSGVNLENFQNKFDLPTTGITSLDLVTGLLEGPLSKGSKINKEFFTDDVLGAGKFKYDGNVVNPEIFSMLDPTEMQEIYGDYDTKRKSGEIDAYGNPTNLNTGGGDDQVIDPCKGPNPPAYCFVDDKKEKEEEEVNPRDYTGIAPRFMGSSFDFTGLANGGIARAGAMDGGRMMMMANQEEDDPEGGIMDLESGRQMYFLGKLVKKAGRAIKKVVKSPIGKAALLYFGGNALMGAGGGKGLGSFFGKGKSLSSLFSGGKSKNLLSGIFDYAKDNPYKSIFGLSTLAGLSGKDKDEDGPIDYGPGIDIDRLRYAPYRTLAPSIIGSNYQTGTEGRKDGGRMGYQEGGDAEPVAKKTMPLLDMDGKEMDLRAEGGFVPLGRMERADDVPARLSKNEFVFTADAVRNAGEGDIDKGAEVMYNMMKNLESGGEVSEESQGLDGAKEMFQTSQRLEEVL